jgi:hypothetical protein
MNGKLSNDKCKLIKRYYSNRISMKAVQGKRKRKTEATHSKKRRGKVKEKQAMRLDVPGQRVLDYLLSSRFNFLLQ